MASGQAKLLIHCSTHCLYVSGSRENCMKDCDSLARKSLITEDFTENNLLVGLCLPSKPIAMQLALKGCILCKLN